MVVTAAEARKRFFELLRRVEKGEEIIVIYKTRRFTITLADRGRSPQ
jgi:antitoxin (DNA-binding transcriptional repressor) of toxin-antitoxin stability system